MGKITKKHTILASKIFDLLDKSTANKQNSGEIFLSRAKIDLHNANLDRFLQYLHSVKTGEMPSPLIRGIINSYKQRGHDSFNTPSDDESFIEDMENKKEVISRLDDPKLSADYDKFISTLQRKFYLKNRFNSYSEKTPKLIKMGNAIGIEIECYIPLSIVGVSSSQETNVGCLNCTGCVSRCGGKSDFKDIIRRELNKVFKKRGIKNVQLVGDGSLDSDYGKLELYQGVEFRVLSDFSDDFDNLKKLCAYLNEIGAEVDKSCGLHVHLDQRGIPFAKTLKTIERLNNSLFGLKSLVPLSRSADDGYSVTTQFNLPVFDNENRGFDISVSDYYEPNGGYIKPEGLDFHLKRIVSPDKVSLYKKICDNLRNNFNINLSVDRYTAINALTFSKTKTVEVRLHSGTISSDKIIKWIKILTSIVNSEKFDSDNPEFKAILTQDLNNIYNWISLTNIEDDSLIKYILFRWKTFNKKALNDSTKKQLAIETLQNTPIISINKVVSKIEMDRDSLVKICQKYEPNLCFEKLSFRERKILEPNISFTSSPLGRSSVSEQTIQYAVDLSGDEVL